MIIEDILERVDASISELLEKEKDILVRGLNELNLNGRFTRYLIPRFEDFEVDPEYNGDKLKMGDRKALDIAASRMREIGINPDKKNNYKLTPDIIIHVRNINENNLVVLEIKKDTNKKKKKEFDLLKLEHMTIDHMGNHYNYKLGIALILGTKKNYGKFDIKYFQNGIQMKRENLK